MSRGGRTGCSGRLGRGALGILGALLVGLGLLGDPARAEDPWPFWGRTATRLGNTTTIGPQTPTIAWSVQVAFPPEDCPIIDSSCVLDSVGRLFVGWPYGITAVDTLRREVIWSITDRNAVYTPAVWQGCVLWTTTSDDSTFYCSDAATGEELWSLPSLSGYGFGSSPVVDPAGVAYVNDRYGTVYARRVEDGSEVWTTQLSSSAYCSPGLDWPSLLVSGDNGSDLTALDPLTGDTGWTFPTGREIFGTVPIHAGAVYLGSEDRFLYSIDARTGEENWRFWCEQLNRGCVAIGHDGVIYTATTGNFGILYAVSPDGDELWRHELPGLVSAPPIVAGDGTIYVSAASYSPTGWFVQAVRCDGTELWTKQMPDMVWSSPMLAPDGTLYVVCKDKYLYAFHDPPVQNDAGGQAEPTQVRPLPPP